MFFWCSFGLCLPPLLLRKLLLSFLMALFFAPVIYMPSCAHAKPPMLLRANSLPSLTFPTNHPGDEITGHKGPALLSPTLHEAFSVRPHRKKTGHKPLIRLAAERQFSNSSTDGSGSEGYFSGSDSDISLSGGFKPDHEKQVNRPQNLKRVQERFEDYKKKIGHLIEGIQRLGLHSEPGFSTLSSISPFKPRSDINEKLPAVLLPQKVNVNPSPIFHSLHSLSDNERMEKLADLFSILSVSQKKAVTNTVTILDTSGSTAVKANCKQACSTALITFEELTGLLTRGIVFIGGSILIFYYPTQTVQATILIADPSQTSPYTGRVVDYSLCRRNYLATFMRFLLITMPPIIDSFALKLSEVVRDQCNKLSDRHICSGGDCIFTQDINGHKTCLLRDMATYNFIKTVNQLGKDQQIIVLCVLSKVPNDVSSPIKKLPLTATPGEIAENLIVHRDWRYLVHTFSYAIYCSLAGVYIIFGNHLETAVITLVADATIEQNNTDIFANQTQQSLSVTGNVTNFTPELTPYLVSTISLYAAYYLTPKVLPLVQRGCSYLYNKCSSRRSYRKRRYSPSWV